MLIALVNDSHFGARNSSDVIIKQQETFFKNVFFPELKKRNIKNVVHLGDLFDKRKSIDFKPLFNCRRFFFEPLLLENISTWILAGNHDCTYKDHNNVNAVDLLCGQYPNIKTITQKPEIVNFDGLDIGLFPWICKENHDVSLDALKEFSCPIIMGHFEIQGFEVDGDFKYQK